LSPRSSCAQHPHGGRPEIPKRGRGKDSPVAGSLSNRSPLAIEVCTQDKGPFLDETGKSFDLETGFRLQPHEFLLHKNRMEAYERTFAFIDRFIGKKR